MTTIIFIFLIIVSSLFCYVLFSPFYLELDSTKNTYRLRFPYLACISLQMINDSLFLKLKVLAWTKQLDILATRPKMGMNRPETVQKTKKRKTTTTAIPWKRIMKVLVSFRFNYCKIAIDLGDVQANALLFPIVYWIKIKSKKNIEINFTGKNEIILEMENSLARMSWAYLSSS